MEEIKENNEALEQEAEPKTLEDFLLGSDINHVTNKVRISNRFPDKEEFYFEVKAMTAEEKEKYRKMSYKNNSRSGRIFDNNKFIKKVIIGQTLKPRFDSVDLMNKAGVYTPEECVDKLLLSGEQETLVQVISEISGFDNPLKYLVDQAKN